MKKRGKVARHLAIRYLYSEYRYGERRHIGLPGLPGEKRLKGQRRAQALDLATGILKQWTRSPFEFEGPVRAGLRTGLVLEGLRWARADFEAESIVGEGLRTIGAKRPDWNEGQRREVDRGDFCTRCGRSMPDELVTGGRNQRFCSVVCAEAAIADRNAVLIAADDKARTEALDLVRRESGQRFVCETCGKSFVPFNASATAGTHQYCSHACQGEARSKFAKAICPQCGNEFRPGLRDGRLSRYCSKPCANAAGRVASYEHICVACGTAFTSKMPFSRYCGHSCAVWMHRLTSDKAKGRVSPRLVDYVFKAPLAMALHQMKRDTKGDRPA